MVDLIREKALKNKIGSKSSQKQSKHSFVIEWIKISVPIAFWFPGLNNQFHFISIRTSLLRFQPQMCWKSTFNWYMFGTNSMQQKHKINVKIVLSEVSSKSFNSNMTRWSNSFPELLITNSNGYIDHNLTFENDAQPKVQTLYEQGLDQSVKLCRLRKRIWDEGRWHFVPKLVPIWLDHTWVTYFKIYINLPCKVLKLDRNQDHDKQAIS